MNKYLLDTHVLLWAISKKEKLSQHAAMLMADVNLDIYVSQVSLWEIAIKIQIGKLQDFTEPVSELITVINETGFIILPIADEHIVNYSLVTYFTPNHKDPFDRLLIAIADAEKMAIITKDEKFDAYKDVLTIVW